MRKGERAHADVLGWFDRVLDRVSVPGGFFSMASGDVATVRDFSLDRYPVTVERFRRFVAAFDGTFPAAGAGAHPDVTDSGWNPAWNALLDLCRPTYGDSSGLAFDDPAQSNSPMVDVSWPEATAFCLWDGGRLPTDAEWEYAAAGGDEQRAYPWGSALPDPTRVTCSAILCWPEPFPSVGLSPAGAGRWGHLDLLGLAAQWVYATVGESGPRAARGPAADDRSQTEDPSNLCLHDEEGLYPISRLMGLGMRCAR